MHSLANIRRREKRREKALGGMHKVPEKMGQPDTVENAGVTKLRGALSRAQKLKNNQGVVLCPVHERVAFDAV